MNGHIISLYPDIPKLSKCFGSMVPKDVMSPTGPMTHMKYDHQFSACKVELIMDQLVIFRCVQAYASLNEGMYFRQSVRLWVGRLRGFFPIAEIEYSIKA